MRLQRCILILAIAACTSLYAQNGQRPIPTLTMKPLPGRLQLVDGGLGNMILMRSGNEILFVDTKSAEAGGPIRTLLDTGFSGTRIRYIINTHMHWDHTGNNKVLGEGATIIAHRNARRKPTTDSSADEYDSPPVGSPNLLVDSTLSLFFGGEEIRLIHYPLSHTNHDLAVYFTKSKVIALGDMYFAGMYPFIATGGTLNGLIADLESIINMLPADVTIVPGHGPVATLDDLRATHAMLVGTAAFVKQQITAGKSLEVIKKEGLSQWTPTWGKGFCREDCWIETLYSFLKP